MGAEQLNSFAQSAYDYGFRRDAHQLIAWGYQDALSAIHCKLLEEEITGPIDKEQKQLPETGTLAQSEMIQKLPSRDFEAHATCTVEAQL